MERLLSELVDRLRKAHKDALVSVVLYGSGAAPESRDGLSDYNVLCVLRQVTPSELHNSESVFRWWREMKNPAPLLLSADEVLTSTDCFPIEFHDICERHRVLFGDDVIKDLEVDDAFYRAQVEHELRAKMLRLRQKAGGLISEKDLLLRLMCDSVSTFCVLFRHALRLGGDSPHYGKREVIAAAHDRFGIVRQPFETLLDIREDKLKPKQVANSVELFASYLKEIQAVVDAVNRMER